MRILSWITKATDAHIEYVILFALQQQQWLREPASVLRVYVHCDAYDINRSAFQAFMSVSNLTGIVMMRRLTV